MTRGTTDKPARGLTAVEVAERVADGRVNINADVKTKSVGQIVAEHALTLFNVVNVGLAALVASTGQYRNMLFVGVVVSNLVIGVFQEIRAKVLVDRLSILTAKDVTVRRDGTERAIPVDQVVVDDLVLLSHGDQVPADGTVLRGGARMDESLLSGESNAIEKDVGDEVLSGSFVDSGSLEYRVTRVGAQGYAARINAEAKYVKAVHSEIMDTVQVVIRVATYLLVPMGLSLFLRTLLSSGGSYQEAALQSVAALVGMIPQGLVLLTSSVFAIATTRLASRKVLVQQSYCVETLARVDVLCLDKTGTITTGAMEVCDVVDGRGMRGEASEAALAVALIVTHANRADANETARAILSHGTGRGMEPVPCIRAVPFSSRTKYSGCTTADGRSLVLGAAQLVLGNLFATFEPTVRSFDPTVRVLVCAEVEGFAEDGSLQGVPRVVGFVGIRDQVRENAAQTMRFFLDQGVSLRVISGDDPLTVSAIAKSVGIPGAERCIDASGLEDTEELARAVRDCRVFGRVTPQLKRELVRQLRARGHTIAMTGDGVNDVLALKEADCSVAMASGSAAARNVAEIVLADNDFAHMPEVVAEGRRSINNLQRSASLFLTKTAYSAVLALVCILMPPYPLIPIQMSIISTAVIGVPSFLLALEPNHDRVSGAFLGNVLSRSLPASAAIVCELVATLVLFRALGWSRAVMSTLCMVQIAAVGVALIWRISRPLNPLRLFVLAFSVVYVIVSCTVCGDFIRVEFPAPDAGVVCAAVCACGVVFFNMLYDVSSERLPGSAFLESLNRKVGHIHDSND